MPHLVPILCRCPQDLAGLPASQKLQWRLSVQTIVSIEEESHLHPGVVSVEHLKHLLEVCDCTSTLKLPRGIRITPSSLHQAD